MLSTWRQGRGDRVEQTRTRGSHKGEDMKGSRGGADAWDTWTWGTRWEQTMMLGKRRGDEDVGITWRWGRGEHVEDRLWGAREGEDVGLRQSRVNCWKHVQITVINTHKSPSEPRPNYHQNSPRTKHKLLAIKTRSKHTQNHAQIATVTTKSKCTRNHTETQFCQNQILSQINNRYTTHQNHA